MQTKLWRLFVRLVLDTNILISGLLSENGSPGKLLDAWVDGDFELLTATEKVLELTRVLGYEKILKRVRPDRVREFMENVEGLAVLATDLPMLTVSPDPDDNIILAIAVAGRADALVSGDRVDVLDLSEVAGIPIITAREAVVRLGLEA